MRGNGAFVAEPDLEEHGQASLYEGGVLPPGLAHGTQSTADDSNVTPALSYDELRQQNTGPNRDFRSLISELVPHHDPILEVPDPEVKRAALATWEARRAYNGAPPVVPHPIAQQSSAACLACHGPGLRVGDLTASRVPHATMTSCTQCHVEQVFQGTIEPAEPVVNGFKGLPAPFEGPRAGPGAPPLVPHSTLMRTECLSCHGPSAPAGLQTTHPERLACLQCHAPSAELNQHARVEEQSLLPGLKIVGP
jgi:cytochrome c-type protein NapB